MLKNITLTAEEELIKKAREKAVRENTTLNSYFRQWLKQLVGSELKTSEFESLMISLSYADPGRKFSREEINER